MCEMFEFPCFKKTIILTCRFVHVLDLPEENCKSLKLPGESRPKFELTLPRNVAPVMCEIRRDVAVYQT